MIDQEGLEARAGRRGDRALSRIPVGGPYLATAAMAAALSRAVRRVALFAAVACVAAADSLLEKEEADGDGSGGDAVAQKTWGGLTKPLRAYSIGEGFEGTASDWTEYVVWSLGVAGGAGERGTSNVPSS